MIAEKERATQALSRWYADACDGDWEHQFGIEIESLDNPGWAVRIDLAGTSLAGETLSSEQRDVSEEDWYRVTVRDSQFRGYGDPSKLPLLLSKFRAFAEERAETHAPERRTR
ncbi:MAG: hypothetical protein BRD46_01430 [Bacteroidetes bacterium QS_8_68_15]|nr:MAG: hypothetical protein BRD46_01430 [Bacteroidetes bacterium QS_8_68_15]